MEHGPRAERLRFGDRRHLCGSEERWRNHQLAAILRERVAGIDDANQCNDGKNGDDAARRHTDQ